jgi:hypothetical protein
LRNTAPKKKGPAAGPGIAFFDDERITLTNLKTPYCNTKTAMPLQSTAPEKEQVMVFSLFL